MLNQFARYAETSDLILDISRISHDMHSRESHNLTTQFSLFCKVTEDEPVFFNFEELEGPQPSIIKFTESVSSLFRSRIVKAWQHLHPSIQNALSRRDISIHAPASTLEYKDVFFSRSSGNACGVFEASTKAIVVPEFYHWTPAALVPHSDVYHTFYHETGHAIDFCFDLSRKQGFQEAYNADVSAPEWDENSKSRFQYFLWPQNLGSEAFAETWARQTLKKLPELQSSYNVNFESLFPRSWKWVQANAPSAKDGFNLPSATINQRDDAGKTPLQILAAELAIEELIEVLSSGASPIVTNESGKSLIDLYIGWHDVDKVREMVIGLAKMLAVATVRNAGDMQMIRDNLAKWRKFLTGWVGGDTSEALMALIMLERVISSTLRE